MSYYNQPDHELIDRRDEGARAMLLRLASARVRTAVTQPPPAFATASSDSASEWLKEAVARGVPPADAEPLDVDGMCIPLVWRRHYVVALQDAASSGVLARLDDLGFEVIRFEARSTWPRAFEHLVRVLGRTA
jgi:hypothetical protein